MYALTIRQPWAWAIAEGYKDIENRSWKPPHDLLEARIAIHAGISQNTGDYYRVGQLLNEMAGYDVIPEIWAHAMPMTLGAVIAVARIKTWGKDFDSIWYEHLGYGWKFDEIAKIEPVPCRGMQRLWKLPADVEWAVLSQTGLI